MTTTKTYSDGTVVTGTPPFPSLSPTQQDAIYAEAARIISMTDDEVISECRARGEDPDAVAENMKSLISKSIAKSAAQPSKP
jgi:hypothetical protein